MYVEPRTIDLSTWRVRVSVCYLWLAAASLPGVFCLMACRARWNQPQAVNNKPAESSWEEEEQIQELFRKTQKNRQIKESVSLSNVPDFALPQLSGGTKLIPISDDGVWSVCFSWNDGLTSSETLLLASSLKEQNEICSNRLETNASLSSQMSSWHSTLV